jgi:hypothetical protein
LYVCTSICTYTRYMQHTHAAYVCVPSLDVPHHWTCRRWGAEGVRTCTCVHPYTHIHGICSTHTLPMYACQHVHGCTHVQVHIYPRQRHMCTSIYTHTWYMQHAHAAYVCVPACTWRYTCTGTHTRRARLLCCDLHDMAGNQPYHAVIFQ